MTAYNILMLLMLGLAYPLCIRKPSMKKKTVYVSIIFGYMFFMSALRYGIGNDYFHYRTYYYNIIDSGLTFSQINDSYGFEPAYVLLMKLVSLAPDGSEYLLLNILSALITLIPPAYIICRYSKMPWLSSWLFLTITFFYNSMNFTRQSMAAAIIFMGWKFFAERKHFAVLLTVLAASMFHYSVLIMIPVYIVSLIRPSVKSFGIIGGAAVLCLIFSNKLIDIAMSVLPQYAVYEGTVFITKGLSWKYVIIPAVLLIIIGFAYVLGWKDRSPAAGMFMSFGFVNFLIWLFILKHFILERFTLPIYIFMLLAVPDALDFLKDYGKSDGAIMLFRRHKRGAFASVVSITLASTFIYNSFCAGEGVHGVFPYKSLLNPYTYADKSLLKDDPRMVYTNMSFMGFLYSMTMRDYTIIVCASGNAGDKMEIQHKLYLKSLGFDTDINGLNGKSYVGVARGGKAVFETVSDNAVTEPFAVLGKYNITAVSCGENAGNTASIIINGDEYLGEGSGIHFLLIDNETGKIATAQGYDLSTYNYSYIHTNAFNGIQ